MIFFLPFLYSTIYSEHKTGLRQHFLYPQHSTTSLSALTLAPDCIHVVSPTSPLCSMLSDHSCQRDECVKDSSDRTVSFDTRFHSSEPRLKYSFESHFPGVGTQCHISLSFESPQVLLIHFRLRFLRAPGVLLFPQPRLQPEFQRSSAPLSAKIRHFPWWLKASGTLWIIQSCLNLQAFMIHTHGC